MVIPRLLPAALGAVTAVATTAVLVVHIILAHSISTPASAVRITAIIGAVLEAVVLIAIAPLFFSYLGTSARIKRLGRFNGIQFGASLFLSVVAAAVSVATIICLNNAAGSLPSMILGSTATGFLVASSLALGFAFATQLVFLVVYFATTRWQEQAARGATGPRDEENPPQEQQKDFKAIPYQPTSPSTLKFRADESTSSLEPPSSSGGRSATEPVSSIRSSISSVIRPISSKTALISGSPRSLQHRPPSLDPAAVRTPPPRPPRMEIEGFDSWDTSAVDPQNRQTVLETSSPPPGASNRFLETIPASPASRSPSPGMPFDLEPPPPRRSRSRSYSPASSVGTTQAQRRAAFTQHASQSESHIHPLFRSDSPTSPPAITTPGTIVVAAPNAGQVFYSDRQSIRSLVRMRSGSLPTVSSPLSTQQSFESFHHRRGYERSYTTSPEFREEDEEEQERHMMVLGSIEGEERKMTPPIPDWVLSAGSRTSLTGYNSRKLRTPTSPSRPTSRGDHLPSRPPSRGDHFPSRPPSRGDHFPSRPPSRGDHFPSRPPSRDVHYSSRPVSRNDRAPSRPPSRDVQFSSRPPSRDVQFSSRPPSRDVQFSSRPPSRDVQFSSRPVSRNDRFLSRPPSSNGHIDVMANRI